MTGLAMAYPSWGLDLHSGDTHLNHRFGDILHLPRELGQWEERIRRRLSTELARGRVEVW